MAKDAKDFYKGLQDVSDQNIKSRNIVGGVNNQAYVNRMSKKPFPLGKVILLIAGFIFALISNFSKIAESTWYIHKVRPNPVVAKIYNLVDVDDKDLNNEIVLKHAEENNIEMVQIRGRYYPKSPDDTYVVDGETVFYKDKNAKNRK